MSAQTWFITGASSGLGASVANAALRAGHRVAVTARDKVRLEKLTEAHPDAVASPVNGRFSKPPYAALWKSSIWRIQLVSGFHLGKIWATNLRFARAGGLRPGSAGPGIALFGEMARSPRDATLKALVVMHRHALSVVRRTNTAYVVLLIAVIGPVACGSPPPADPPPPPEVAVVTLATESLTMIAELPGRTVAVMVSEVRPQIRGLIQRRLFTEGQQVKAGQVLYQIDPALYQADYDNAKATLARAEAERVSTRLLAERYAELVKIEAVSKQQNDDAAAAHGRAEAEVAAARAALDTARIRLEYTRITAPIGGQVSASVFTPGALVTADQANPLTTVRQLDPIYVDVTQSSDQLLRLQRQLAGGRVRRAGTGTVTVRLRLDDGSEYDHAGRLAFTDVAVDETTGMVRLRTTFPNPKGLLLPGMYIRAFVPQAVDEQGLLVPQQSVTHNARGEAVALVVNGENKVEQRTLTTAGTLGDRWVVRDGVKPGERLIVEGGQKVQPGGTVRTVEWRATGVAQAPAADVR